MTGTFSDSGSRMMLARPVAMVIFEDEQGTRSRRIYWHDVQYSYTPGEFSETAIARSKLVDVSVARWYHCVSRCVHKAFLLGRDGNRKKWLENRLEELGKFLPWPSVVFR
jgi:hypothetical protein